MLSEIWLGLSIKSTYAHWLTSIFRWRIIRFSSATPSWLMTSLRPSSCLNQKVVKSVQHHILKRISLCLFRRLLRGLYTYISVVGFVSFKFTWDSQFDICPINVCPAQYGLQMWIYLTIFICSVGIGTRHRLHGPGIEFNWGCDFPHPKTGPGVHLAFYTMSTGSFPGGKRPGRGVTTYSHRSPRLKKEQSYTFTTPFGPTAWSVLGWVYIHPHQGSCSLQGM